MSSREQNRVLAGPTIITFFYYVIPSMIGLLSLTTASLVDGIFVGNIVGSDALAAVSLLLPYLTFLIAISLMLAIGGAVTAGKYLGEGNTTAASNIMSKTLITAVLVNLFFALLSLALEPTLYTILNVPAHIQPLVTEYFAIIRWVFILQLSTMVLYYFVRTDGHPVLGTKALVIGALTNVVLDWVFILHLDMGIAGAAYATAIAQLIQCMVLVTYFFSPKRTLRFSFKQQNWRAIVSTAYNGVSEFVNEVSVGALFLLLNWLLIAQLGANGVAAFSVVNYFIFLSVMVSYGVADALHLLVSQNYGAKNTPRVYAFLKISLSSVLLTGLLLAGALIFAQTSLTTLFLNERDSEVTELVGDVIGLMWPVFIVNGINILLGCYLTAIHKPAPSALIALCRSILFPATMLVFLYLAFYHTTLLSLSPSPLLFLIALPIAEWLTFVFALIYSYRFRPSTLLE